MANFTFQGSSASDIIMAGANGQHIVLTRDPGNVQTDVIGVDNLLIDGGSGDDKVDASALPAGLTQLTIDGGSGNDTITGSQGADMLIGGSGDDVVIGGRGNDVAQLGSGDDVFVWNPGDGSDTVDGQSGFDTLQFNGANIGEKIDISANGEHVRFTRDVGNIAMDLNGVEKIDFHALGGADNIVVNDLSGTDVKQVAIDLSSPAGSGNGDGQADTVTVNGTAGNDHISVADSGSAVVVGGLAAQVTVDGAEATNDAVVVDGLGGADTLEFDGSSAGETISISANGQSVAIFQNNVLLDVNGVENVVIDGNGGDDVISAGNGLSTLTSLTIRRRRRQRHDHRW
jgi:predicted ester cyclase